MARRGRFGFGFGTGHTRKISHADIVEPKSKDEAMRDEWLREDMLTYYGSEKVKPSSSSAGRVQSGSTYVNNVQWPSPPTSPSAALISKGTNTRDMTEAKPTYTYTPGKLTGDYIHEHKYGGQAAQEPTLRDKIRAAREKLLQEEAAKSKSSLGTHSNTSDNRGKGEVLPSSHVLNQDDGESISKGWVR